MSGIALGGDYTIAQPSDVTEGIVQKVRDKVSANGTRRRIWLGQKYTVTLKWSSITQADYAYITGKFYGTGHSITYNNTYSGLSFTGFADAAEGPFIKGASFKRDLTIQIEQV